MDVSKNNTISLNGRKFFALRSNKKDEIPAIEHDYTTGKFAVLVFSSLESAKRFCYHRGISEVDIVELSRRKNIPMEQIGLLKIARAIDKDYSHIEYFVFDHPGRSGPADFVRIKDMLRVGIKSTKSRNMADFLANHLDPNQDDIWSE